MPFASVPQSVMQSTGRRCLLSVIDARAGEHQLAMERLEAQMGGRAEARTLLLTMAGSKRPQILRVEVSFANGVTEVWTLFSTVCCHLADLAGVLNCRCPQLFATSGHRLITFHVPHRSSSTHHLMRCHMPTDGRCSIALLLPHRMSHQTGCSRFSLQAQTPQTAGFCF
jgi:hypothetical protein